MYRFASKSFTSHAICTRKSLASNRVIGPTPLTALVQFSQLSFAVRPNGLTAPIPVIATRLIAFMVVASAHRFGIRQRSIEQNLSA
jgi:hypothetical protein